LRESTSAELPANVTLSSRTERDLKGLYRKHPQEVLGIVRDMARLALRSIPAGQYKKLQGMKRKLWELDSGRFRVVFYWEGQVLHIVAVFPKADQARIFRHLYWR